MKTVKIVLITILCGLILCLCGLLCLVLRGHDNRQENSIYESSFMGRYELVQETEMTPEGIESLVVQYDMNSNSVYFYEGADETIVIKEYLNFTPEAGQLSTVERQGSRLIIQGKRRDFSSFFLFKGSHSGYTEVYLPADFSAELSVRTSSGDIRADRDFILGDDFAASSVSGDIHLPKVTAKHIDISSTSGDVVLEFAEGNAEVSTTSGDIHMPEGTGDRNVSSVSGDIRIDSIDGCFDLSSTSGDISVNAGKGCGDADTVSGEIRVFLSELQGNLSASTTSGDVSLQIPDNASFALDFDSTSGECNTFFDDMLTFNKKGNHAEGIYGNSSDSEITVSTVSGDLRITRYSY